MIGLPEDASAHGHLVDEALGWSLASGAVLLAFLCAWLAWVLVRRRGPARYEPGSGAFGVAFVVAVFAAAEGPAIAASFEGAPGRAGAPLIVQVNAHQWAWDFRSPGLDGELGTRDDVLAWNELRVPLGGAVRVQLGAVDVVHGFSVPALRVKVDAVPGRLSEAWLEPTRAGRYEILCAQFCGTSHQRMRGELVVMERDAYRAWVAEASRLAALAYDAEDAEGHWAWKTAARRGEGPASEGENARGQEAAPHVDP